MVNNCGMCLTLNPVLIMMCQTVCTLKEDCPNWLDRDSICPDPVILRVSKHFIVKHTWLDNVENILLSSLRYSHY